MVGLVGESRYQPAIRRCREGMAVVIRHEIDNPHDPGALRVDCPAGFPIGYIGRDHWLHRALHKEQKRIAARIASINGGGDYPLGVVLDVDVHSDSAPVATVSRTVHSAPASKPAGAGIGNALGKALKAIFKR